MKVWPQILEIYQISFTNTSLKFHLAVTAFLSALPLLTQALVHPAVGNTLTIKKSEIAAGQPVTLDLAARNEAHVLNKRADDEWVVVMYDNGSGDQCGGVSNQEVTGKKEGLCKGLGNLVGKICTDVKVGINIGVAKCDFSFRTDSSGCGGAEENHVTLYAGEDSNGVSLTDQVRFVSVTCSE